METFNNNFLNPQSTVLIASVLCAIFPRIDFLDRDNLIN